MNNIDNLLADMEGDMDWMLFHLADLERDQNPINHEPVPQAADPNPTELMPAAVIHQPAPAGHAEQGDVGYDEFFIIDEEQNPAVIPAAGARIPRTGYVRTCRSFRRNVNTPLTKDFVVTQMSNLFPMYYEGWRNELQNPNYFARQQFTRNLCHHKNNDIKLLFALFYCIDYFESTDQGGNLWRNRAHLFYTGFGTTIARELSNRVKHHATYQRNPRIVANLEDSFIFVYLLRDFLPLRRNLCFLLMVVSCIEGRGVYHGRNSKGFSMPLQCYRYMIETLGGKNFYTMDPEELKPADTKMIETFHGNNAN